MKLNRFRAPWRAVWTAATLAIGSSAHAGFVYNARDLVLGMRQSGGIFELAVDLGPVSNFYTLAPGTTIPVTNYSAGALGAAFSGLDALAWSVSADVRATGDTNYPLQTLWVTRPRSDANTQTTPWTRQGQYAQGAVGAKISGLGNAAATYAGTVPTGTNNTTTFVVIPAGNPYSYSPYIGVAGNFAGTFQGNVEQTTPTGFATGGIPSRADLYLLIPGSGPGVYLGYFELGTNGVMSYTAGASAPVVPPPTITGIARNGATNTISFTSVTGASYRLVATNTAGLTQPVVSWPVIGAPVAGTGSTVSLSDSSADATRFYVIIANP
ncbi:MAG: hypothetical protein KGS61_09000 [Verrucomicrobia bacterium]|nr:hypothetical protein [Verrucomicrobiota bacterium]